MMPMNEFAFPDHVPAVACPQRQKLLDAGYEPVLDQSGNERWWRRGKHIGMISAALTHCAAVEQEIDKARDFLEAEGYSVSRKIFGADWRFVLLALGTPAVGVLTGALLVVVQGWR